MGDWLKDKVAVITGGGNGIGRAVAALFAEEGAKIVVNDLGGSSKGEGASKQAADLVADEIKKRGGKAVANYDSVATMAGGERIIKTAIDAFGRIDILVTCAGILRDRMVFNMTEQEWDGVLNTHLKGTFACAKPASIVMRQQRSGRIITFTSTSGLYGNTGQANYSSAKGGIAGFTKAASLDLGRYGVTVNAIAPMAGTRMTLTDEYFAAREKRAKLGVKREGFGFDPKVEDMQPDDVAPVVAYVASDASAYINGQVIFIGGGVCSWVAPPRAVKTIYKESMWTVDELIEWVPNTLMVGVTNPAPPPEEQK
ncbi:MAG: SDR family oxidoreductase [Chloroflexi bacterium]|nr:SDR family oxidoreductase [Chloroflexota bacterium]